jgi:hypothetical protein
MRVDYLLILTWNKYHDVSSNLSLQIFVVDFMARAATSFNFNALFEEEKLKTS